MREILSGHEATRGMERIVSELLASGSDPTELALVGIRRGGVPLAEWLAHRIQLVISQPVPTGSVDITLYRDDAPVPLPNPRIGRSEVPFDVANRRIVLVDDVLYTGRTVRAAMHALLDYGRSRSIQLAVLVDRGGRELPIQPDYLVKRVDVPPAACVDVLTDGNEFRAVVVEP